MSSHPEVYEDEDSQQAPHVAEITDRDVQAILATIADQIAHEETSAMADYIRVTLAEGSPIPTYMDDTTAIRIGRWLSHVIAQAADDRVGMLAMIGGVS